MNLVVIQGKDLTKYIQDKTYKVNKSEIYDEWQDGNYRTHRIVTRTKISGTFDVVLYGGRNVVADFLESWEKGVNNGVLTGAFYVNNTDKIEMIEAYYTITVKEHEKATDNKVLNILTIKIEER